MDIQSDGRKPAMPDARRDFALVFISFALIFGVLFFLYRQSLYAGFVFDDWGDLGWVINWPRGEWGRLFLSLSPFSGQLYSITIFIWRLEFISFGFDSFYFHLSHLILHMFNTWLVFTFARRQGSSVNSALLTTFFFACSSALITAVAWISAGIDLPLILLGIPSLLCYIAARNNPPKPKQFLFLVLAGIFFLLALKCKLMGLSVLASFVCYEAVFKVPDWNIKAVTRWCASLIKFNFFFWAIAIVHVFSYQKVNGTIPTTGEYGYSLSPLNYLRSVGWYLNQVLGGFNISMVLVSLIGVFALLLAWRMRNRLMIFGAMWFFLTLFPVAILKIHHYPHHLYFPTVGAAIYFGEAFSQLLAWFRLRWTRLTIPLFAIIVIGYLGLAYPKFTKYSNDAVKGWQLTQKTLGSLKEIVPLLPNKNVKFLVYPRPPGSLFNFVESIQMTYSRFNGIELQVFDSENDFRESVHSAQQTVDQSVMPIALVYDQTTGLLKKWDGIQ